MGSGSVPRPVRCQDQLKQWPQTRGRWTEVVRKRIDSLKEKLITIHIVQLFMPQSRLNFSTAMSIVTFKHIFDQIALSLVPKINASIYVDPGKCIFKAK